LCKFILFKMYQSTCAAYIVQKLDVSHLVGHMYKPPSLTTSAGFKFQDSDLWTWNIFDHENFNHKFLNTIILYTRLQRGSNGNTYVFEVHFSYGTIRCGNDPMQETTILLAVIDLNDYPFHSTVYTMQSKLYWAGPTKSKALLKSRRYKLLLLKQQATHLDFHLYLIY